MAKRQTTLRRSKNCEISIQQYLWPGTHFSGGAKRPALERCDLRGDDADGWPLWGECKNYDLPTIGDEGGTHAVLSKALVQAEQAIAESPTEWPVGPLTRIPDSVIGYHKPVQRPRAFAVLWPKGCRRDDQKLVMYRLPGWGTPAIITLAEFKRRIVDGEPWEEGAVA